MELTATLGRRWRRRGSTLRPLMTFATRLVVAFAALTLAVRARTQAPTPTTTTVLRAARVIDGTGAAAIANGVVVVTDDRIIAVGRSGAVHRPGRRAHHRPRRRDAACRASSTRTRTSSVATLGDPGRRSRERARTSTRYGAILSVVQRATHADGRLHDDPQRRLRQLRRHRAAQGDQRRQGSRPAHAGRRRTRSASPAATATRTASSRASWTATRRTGIADGTDEVRAAVRYQVKYGADVIKTCATGGVLSEGDAVG